MKQYEIRWASMPEPIGRRPVLLLSRDGAYRYLERVMIAEVTTTIRGIPVEVEVGKREGLHVPSVVNLDNVHVIVKRRLADRIGDLGRDKIESVKRAFGYAVGWSELTTL